MIEKVHWNNKDVTLSRFTILAGDINKEKFLKEVRSVSSNHRVTYKNIYFLEDNIEDDDFFEEFDVFCFAECICLSPNDYQKYVQCLIRFFETHQDKQIVIATNDCLFLKNCYVEAIKDDCDIRCVDFDGDEVKDYNIKDCILDNSVVNESIETYKREILL